MSRVSAFFPILYFDRGYNLEYNMHMCMHMHINMHINPFPASVAAWQLRFGARY